MSATLARSIALRGMVVLALVYLIVPLTMVLPVSLTDQRALTLPVHGLSLQHYAALLRSADWLTAAAQSLVIGIAATAVALAVGVTSAIGCWLLGAGRGGLVRALNLLPIVIPAIIYALGAYRFYAEIGLLDTYVGVILAHAVGAVPFVFVAAGANLEHLDRSLVRAAQSLGAGLVRTALTVVVPNIRPGVLSGAIFAFLHSWDEVVVTLFVSSRDVRTLPRRMWEAANEDLDPVVACVAVLLLAITLALLLAEHRVKRRPSPSALTSPPP